MCVPRGASHERSLPDMPCPSHPLDMAESWSPNPFLCPLGALIRGRYLSVMTSLTTDELSSSKVSSKQAARALFNFSY